MRRRRIEIARAVLRLAGEELLRVSDLVEETGASAQSLTRWIVQGRRGCHLDGVHRPGVGWMTSRAALERFRAASEAAVKGGVA